MSRPPAPPLDDGGTLTLRPRSAPLICIAAWALCGALLVDAVLRAGWPGLRVLPFLALIAAVVWALLWAPRVVLHRDEVDVVNVLTHIRMPFGAIRQVRLGAMLRFDAVGRDGREHLITAWNAPGIGRDGHGALLVRGAGAGGRGRMGPHVSPGERLAQDRMRSRSYVVLQRWERWADAHGAPEPEVMTTHVRGLPCVVVGVTAIACLLRLLLD